MELNQNFRDVISNLNEINLQNLIPLESCKTEDNKEIIKLGKVIIHTKDSNRRIDEKSDVKFSLRKYICLKEDKSMKIFNKDYKNICKRTIEKMTAEENIIRKCLLNLYDKQVAWFVVHKEIDAPQYKRAKLELKIEDMSLYEDVLYYQIIVDSVIYPQPSEPKVISQFDKFIKKYQDEIRYFLSIEDYTNAISWSNSIMGKFFTMNKELKKQMTEEMRKKLQPELKSVLLNKTLAYLKKPNKENNGVKDYEEIIKIFKEYCSHFPEKDDKYVKITKRLIKCYLEVRDLEKAENVIKDLSEISKNDDELQSLQNELNKIRSQQQKKNKKNIFEMFKNSTEDDYDSSAFIWDHAVPDKNQLNFDGNLEFSISNVLVN
jgi:hypothetical protein